ncbi:MAG: prevent-host-death protein [Spirochaetes bacterium RBG_16_49_21]|nr:MAG: prevent-host-death protein [Spirochaetes bacterium RBG_16_49_21]
MKFISVRDIRTKPASIWSDLKKEHELVVTNNGKPIALLTPLSESNLEETLRAIRKARATEALSSMRRKSAMIGTVTMTMDEITSEIKKHRSGK